MIEAVVFGCCCCRCCCCCWVSETGVGFERAHFDASVRRGRLILPAGNVINVMNNPPLSVKQTEVGVVWHGALDSDIAVRRQGASGLGIVGALSFTSLPMMRHYGHQQNDQ